MSGSSVLRKKICKVCGRSFSFRKKWEKVWDQVQYCSDRCRRDRDLQKSDFEAEILKLLSERASSASICPSEFLPLDQRSDKAMMEKVRQAARRLAHRGKIEITQRGQRIDPDDFRGPIRLRTKK